jgi:hypothetical protein
MNTTRSVAIAAASSGANALVAAAAGKIIRVMQYTLVAAGTVTAKFQSASTDLTGAMSMIVGLPIVAAGPVSTGGRATPLFQTVAGEALNISLGGAVAVAGHLVIEEVSTTP